MGKLLFCMNQPFGTRVVMSSKPSFMPECMTALGVGVGVGPAANWNLPTRVNHEALVGYR